MTFRTAGDHIQAHHAAIFHADLAEEFIPFFACAFACNKKGWASNPILSIHVAYPRLRLHRFLRCQLITTKYLGGALTFHHIFHPNQIGCDDRFHIRRAASPEIIAFDARGELGVIWFGFDNIEMTC